MQHPTLRHHLTRTAQRLVPSGLVRGTSGNVSARTDGGMLITPSAVPYEEMTAGGMVFVRMDGVAIGGKPSSEWRMHLDVYRNRADARAIVHTHSTYATVLACAGLDLPAFHYMVAAANTDRVRCAGYATYGTQALSDNALAALGTDANACLLGHHGVLALGSSLDHAFGLAEEIEHLSEIYVHLRQLGPVEELPAEEMQRVQEAFKSYKR
ncbi:MAG: class II aldolase/adducin family protein [Bacteroidota bacterium]